MAKAFRQKLDIIGVENLVFDDRLQIAGTIDLLGKSRKNGNYLVLDWKSNASIEQDNKYNKFGLDPIRHIPDTAFYHYSLQLSMYQFLLKFGGYVPNDANFQRAIIHVTDKFAKIIELPDLTSEIKDIIIAKHFCI